MSRLVIVMLTKHSSIFEAASVRGVACLCSYTENEFNHLICL